MALKCVAAVDSGLPAGLKANIVGVLCLTIGKKFPDIIGEDTFTVDDFIYAGITQVPIPILTASTERLRDILVRARDNRLFVASFTDAALKTKNYTDYRNLVENTEDKDLTCHGLCLVGKEKHVKRITSDLPLMR